MMEKILERKMKCPYALYTIGVTEGNIENLKKSRQNED